jgi:hypothetical protein
MTTLPTPEPYSVTPPPDQPDDPLLYRVLVWGLVGCVAVTIAAIFALAVLQRPIPEGLVAIGSACVGGLVGLLVPSPAGR